MYLKNIIYNKKRLIMKKITPYYNNVARLFNFIQNIKDK